jgi:hypothetical protein
MARFSSGEYPTVPSLIAVVGAVLLTLVLGAARFAQLCRLVHKHER